ncbi:MAG: aminotransferase class V-fold PLP-dependent enzyme [Sandaracinus sp.]
MTSPDARHFVLREDIVMLNHGSFGACPRVILERHEAMLREWESDPIGVFDRLEARLDAARNEVAALVGADPAGFVFVRNATMGVNAVLQSFPLRAGDAVLTTDHAYQACKNALDHWAGRAGARIIVARVPFPLASPDEVTDAIDRAWTKDVRLALVDHITSPTGLVFPIADIVRLLEGRGTAVIVDGAHAPGMVPLAVRELGASYYTGNFHKWMCAPKGAAMLWAREDRRAGLHPTCISHGLTARTSRGALHDEFDWTGTDDFAPWLLVGASAATMAAMAGSLEALRESNRALALEARRILTTKLGIAPPAPESMIGTLVALPLGERTDAGGGRDPLYEALFARGFRVPVFPWPTPRSRVLRVSAQRYNDASQYEALADAILALRAAGQV